MQSFHPGFGGSHPKAVHPSDRFSSCKLRMSLLILKQMMFSCRKKHLCVGVLADKDFGAVDVTIPQESQAKCAVSSCCSSLNGLPGHLMVPAVQSFVCCLQEELKTTDVYLYRKVLDNLASCMEDFSLGTVTSNVPLVKLAQHWCHA